MIKCNEWIKLRMTATSLTTRGSTSLTHCHYKPAYLWVYSHLYLLPGCAAVRQRDAFVDEALVGAYVLIEDLLNRQAAFKHLHLFLLLQCHLKPLLSSQDLLLQGRLQFLQTRKETWGHQILKLLVVKLVIIYQTEKHHFHSTSISCGSHDGIEMCWSRHDGSLNVKIWPFPSNTSSSCKLTHNTWLCFLFSSVRWAKTAPVACTQQVFD